MTTRYFRLDRLLSEKLQTSRSSLRAPLAAGLVRVNGEVEKDRQRVVGPFDLVSFKGQKLHGQVPVYLMMNKPAGVVSATCDAQHTTVLDLVPEGLRSDLHLAGRLDFNSTGLVLLTNDGVWSKRLSHPETGVWKHYRVTLESALDESDVAAFAAGMRFDFEDLTTRPARLKILRTDEADVWLQEGRYHQIRRMFAQRGNKVKTLHRLAVGNVVLDSTLAPGECRALTETEVRNIAD